MALALASVVTSFEALLRTNSATASVAVRAALGNGATSIVKADELDKESLPTLPLLAFRWQTQGGARSQVQSHYPFIYIYDGLQKYWTRINPLIDLITLVYYEIDCITYCETDYLAASGEITDDKLGLRCKYIPFVVKTR